MQLLAAVVFNRSRINTSNPMNRLPIIIAAVFLCSTGLAQEKIQLKDQKDKVSYSIGLDIGFTFKKQNMDMNPDAILAGIKDALNSKPQLTPDQTREVMAAFQKDMVAKQEKTNKEASVKNTADGQKFLADNKTKEGVKTTASGLQYKVLKEGSGATPRTTDTVTVNYRGTLIDGTEFDSSYKRGEPITFPVTGVIPGWTEALQLMKVGSKYQLVIPANLAYGERGAGQTIGPNSTLIFEVELVGIQGAQSPSPSPAK
jgi:FKBP-type peptidyl-prolyl cis-trans isomerase FklB